MLERSKSFNLLRLDMSDKYNTPQKESGSDSPHLSFLGTAPSPVTRSNLLLLDSPEPFNHASLSSTEEQRNSSSSSVPPLKQPNQNSPNELNDTLDLGVADSMNTHLLDAVELDSLMSLTTSSPPLSSFKTEEEDTTAEVDDSSPEKEGNQTSNDSPDSKSTSTSASSRSINSFDMWQTRFEELKKYKAEHGNTDVPQKFGSLGIWVNKQRNGYTHLKKGKSSQLTQERITQLKSIGFRWAQQKGPPLWEKRFTELKEFKKKVRLFSVML